MRIMHCLEPETKFMDVDYRPETPPDLAAGTEFCRNESARSDSDSSSITVDRDTVHRYSVSAERDQHKTWTNEKHNSYLGSLEASFVKQLHQSLGLFSCRPEHKTKDTSPSQKLPPDGTYSFDKRFNLVKHQPSLYHTTGPRECNMTKSERMPVRGKRSSCRLTNLEHQITHPKHPQAISTTAEVSDQNFVDEEREEKSISSFRAKRLKIAASGASTKDQIVPLGRLFTPELSTASSKVSERIASAS